MDAEEKKNENLPSLLPNWLNPKKSGDTRLFMIIAGAIIVALAIFFIGKGIYDGIQAEAAKQQAAVAQQQAAVAQQARDAAEQAREEQVRQETARQQAIQKQIAPLQNLMMDIGAPGTTRSPIGNGTYSYVLNLKGLFERAQDYVAADIKFNNGPAELAKDTQMLSEKAADLKKAVDDYNSQAAKVDPAVLIANNLPKKLGDNGEPIQ